MRAGQLDRQISIEYKEVSQDPVYGTEIITWQPLFALPGSPRVAVKLWANLVDMPPSRSEAVRQGIAVSATQTKCTLRYRAGITSDMRVVWHGTTDVTYQIIGGPAIVGRREWLELMLEAYSS